MSEKTATERLREMLDERGVEYLDSEDDTTIYYADSGYRYTYNVNPDSGWACVYGYHLTPEQAVEATLGRETCEVVKDFGNSLHRVRRCPDCGEVVDA